MSELILHHYPLSFFAEKIRRILAYKQLPWRSVEQPIMMPKPALTPLTGGYRRVPVLQIGADVYCDTACIARRLEQLHPEPACIPPSQAGAAALIEDWADHRFVSQIMPTVVLELLPTLPEGILADRVAMTPTMAHDVLVAAAPHTRSQARISFDRLEQQLRERPFLLGDAFTIADAACFHPLWFARRSAVLLAELRTRLALEAWFARIEAFGAGDTVPMQTDEALAIARDAKPADLDGSAEGGAEGPALGDNVAIVADDYGREESRGIVVRLRTDEITILRTDRGLGEIAVHYPRAGYRIAKVG